MLGGGMGNMLFGPDAVYAFREYWVFLLFAVLCATPLFGKLREHIDKSDFIFKRFANVGALSFYMFAFIYSISLLIFGANNPFIYFNF
jgi:hypothetical protein